ncbi:unnamed protein product [Didymodactylos carnosus]|uniref:Dynactin subunit 2 n=1 Tax=Didymodactylos carnosus TaxID=1234261 RepID=A0A813PP70_9BILA|nr:unnamed protein product [Didymodactylos carnosus]CAF0793724.1 unnamed protein product [Didymodactylos carnosus]CAF3533342.1 unnamed protein product [Didymodactylos carnosus]CAF3576564.1 unnamed protein product [Didymodactylos carnosus]
MMKKLTYANLPGIANDQPDCFETPDYPLPDQYHEIGNDNTDSVTQFDINTKEIHKTFNGKYLNGNAADFSNDSIKVRGYIQRGVYQNHREPESETPIERYKRIMRELHELEIEFGEKSKDGKSLSKEENKNLNAVVKHVQQLHEQTSKVYGAKYLISGDSKSLDYGTDAGSLLNKLTMRHSTSKDAKKQEKSLILTKNEENSGSEAFKLYISPRAPVSNTPLRNSIPSESDSKSLISTLEHLSNRFDILKQQNLEHLDVKLSNVLTHLNAVNEKKALVDEQDKQSKATELFDMMSRWENMAASLPQIEERLVALNALHQRAFQFSSALTHYNTEQQTLKTSLDSNDHLLKQLKTTFQTNLELLKTQLESLDRKILNKK